MDQDKALAVIKQHENDLVYVRPEDLQTQRMFVPQVTVLHAVREDFHERPINGKIMPKSHHVDRIGEAAGVEFIADQCGTRKEGDDIYVGWAQGKKRMPDGSYRTSTKQEYEFDVDVRAQETFAKDKKGKYNSESAKQLCILELKKVARQRASTGARLRVIRELVGIPIAFEPSQIQKAMVVSRIAINTDELLDNPDTRQLAIETALDGKKIAYGPRDVSPERERLPEPEIAADVAPDPDDDFDTFDAGNGDADPRRELIYKLDDWRLDEIIASSPQAQKAIDDVLANEDASAEDLQAVIDRCASYVERKRGGAA